MKPVDQTKFGVEEGNCFAACIATLLDLTLDDCDECSCALSRGGDWWQRATDFLSKRGLFMLDLKVDWESRSEWQLYAIPSGVLCIISGPSPRGNFNHAIVGRAFLETKADGELSQRFDIVHDPHPSRAGFAGNPTMITFLSKLDPAA